MSRRRARTKSDSAFLDNVSNRDLKAFRDYTFSPRDILQNPTTFLDTDWVDVDELRAFLKQSVPESSKLAPCPIKQEPGTAIKLEPDTASTTIARQDVKTRSTVQNGHEVLEILDSSDSEVEPQDDASGTAYNGDTSDYVDELDELLVPSPTPSSPSPHAASLSVDHDEKDADSETVKASNAVQEPVDAACDSDEDLEMVELVEDDESPSPVKWMEPNISSISWTRRDGKPIKITREVSVQRIERVSGSSLPSYLPIPDITTAFLFDFRDTKYDKVELRDGKLATPDTLLLDSDQDSWHGHTGKKDSHPEAWCRIFEEPDNPDAWEDSLRQSDTKIHLRRVRQECSGAFACEKVDSKLMPVERRTLDEQAFKFYMAEVMKSRLTEADTMEKNAIIFWHIVTAHPCSAMDDIGVPCDGVPKLVRMKEQRNGQDYMVQCSRWSSTWKEGHMRQFIPDRVDIRHLQDLAAGKPLPGMEDVACTRIISTRIGARIAKCNYPHNSDGSQSRMIKHDCPARRNIFIPVDAASNSSLRLALVVPDISRSHTHPVLPATKANVELKELLRKCIQANGALTSTVQSIDKAPATRLITNGKALTAVSPALQSRRLQRTVLYEERRKESPLGLGIEAVMEMVRVDAEKPLAERYVHTVTMSPSGGTLVYTGYSYLLNLVHDAFGLHVDTTFKRVRGELKEWEMVIWYSPAARAVTIARIYTNKADQKQYKTLFDGLRQLTLQLTGRKLLFRRLHPDGNLRSLNLDLEKAQVIGACESILEDNVPEFSCIHIKDPLELARYIIRACLTHSRRGVLDFEGLVSSDDFRRLMEWPYIKDQEELDVFRAFIKELDIAKISRWWKHKEDNPWILSAVIQSQSLMNREDWYTTDATTNIGEAQHGWSANQTGQGLSLVAAIKEAQRVDYQVQEEVRDSVESGALRNPNNTAHHRMNNALRRSDAAFNKRRENQHRDDEITRLQTEAAEAASAKKAADAALKTARAEKTASTTQRGKQRKPQYRAESSSSGRAKRSTHVAAPVADPINGHSDMTPSSTSGPSSSQPAEPQPRATPSIAISSISNVPEQSFEPQAPALSLPDLEIDEAWLNTLTPEDFQAMYNMLSQESTMQSGEGVPPAGFSSYGDTGFNNAGFGVPTNGLSDLTSANMSFSDFDGFGGPLSFAFAGESTSATSFSSAEPTAMLPGGSVGDFDLAPALKRVATGPAADTNERSTQVRRVHEGGDVVEAMQAASTHPSTISAAEGVSGSRRSIRSKPVSSRPGTRPPVSEQSNPKRRTRRTVGYAYSDEEPDIFPTRQV